METETLRIGIFGFGCVGQGLYQVLSETKGIKADIGKICIKNPEKTRSAPSELFTTDRFEILDNPNIDVVVELIDDAEEAFEITCYALRQGKAVVSANKKMVAEHLKELYRLQQEYNVPVLYEGACCASIPIIRNLEEYYDNDLLSSVQGIFNGSCNYILSRMFEEGQDFDEALARAQQLGFAETDPTLDIEAFDPTYKLCIVILHAFGLFIAPEDVFHFGIHRLNDFDIAFARQRGATIRLVAHCERSDDTVISYCVPKLVENGEQWEQVQDEYNGINLQSTFSESQLMIGKGAGAAPTGTAVLSDIAALNYRYRYEYKKLGQKIVQSLTAHKELEVYIRYKTGINIPIEAFSSISEKFGARDYSYVIGKISLEILQQADWLRNEEVNLLLTN